MQRIFLSAPRVVTRSLAVVAVLGSAALTAHAQYENGSLVGTIHDATGAPVAGATVKVTNAGTSNTVQVTTNGSGEYDVPQLRVGTYSVTASAAGFSAAVAQNITVSVNVRQHIDLGLTVGGTETIVEVSDVALQLETESSQRDQTVTNYQSEAFPLVTRNYSDLLGLVTGSRQAPSAATTSSINSLTRAGSYNINGERSMFNNFLLDGMDNNAYGESNQGFDNQIIAIPPDSVAQFNVVTNNESAEYGRSSGATINVASNAGTNAFHATVYEFLRNTALNATGFFKPTNTGGSGIVVPFKKPTFNRNQFGFNVGGPVVRDKLFFFLDYEGFRQVLKPLSVLDVTDAERIERHSRRAGEERVDRHGVRGEHADPPGRDQSPVAADHCGLPRCPRPTDGGSCRHRPGAIRPTRCAGAVYRQQRQRRPALSTTSRTQTPRGSCA